MRSSASPGCTTPSSCLAVDLVVVALALVVLVAVPGVVALLQVHGAGAVGVPLAVVEGVAGGAAAVVLGPGAARAPPVGVDLEQTVVLGAICIAEEEEHEEASEKTVRSRAVEGS